MSIEVLVPTLPESISDATLITWHKQLGDFVNKNESLVDLETDKVVLEVTAPEAGILSQILKDNGSIVTGGEVLALLEVNSAQPVVNPSAKSETDEMPGRNNDDIPLSPSVRRLIHENTLAQQLLPESVQLRHQFLTSSAHLTPQPLLTAQ